MTITPEHDKRELATGLHPDVLTAYNYVASVIHTADAGDHAWHGWALREAFLAGISYCQQRPSTPTGDRTMNCKDARKKFEAAFDVAWQQRQAALRLGASYEDALATYNMALEVAESEYREAISEIVTRSKSLLVSFG